MVVLRRPAWRGALTGLACAVICWACQQTSWLRTWEDWSLDNALLLRGRRASTARIVIVRIDESCLERLGKPLMFSSPELAEVVLFLRAAGAAAIGVDLLLPESKQTIEYLLPGQPGDSEKMGQAVTQAGNAVLPIFLIPDQPPIYPAYEWRSVRPPQWSDLGYVNLTADLDSFVRRQQLRAHDLEGKPIPGFALAVFGKAAGLPATWLDEPRLQLDERPIPLDAEGMLRINYVGPPGSIDSIPFEAVLDAARSGPPLARELRGATVLIGTVGRLDPDRHATPYLNRSLVQILRRDWLGHQPELMSGVEIHAQVIATLADRAFIITPWWLSPLPWLLLIGAALGAALVRLNLAWGAALVATHHVAWRMICLAAFSSAHWRVELTSMLLLGVLLYAVTFALRWRWMRRMLGLVKSEAIAQALESDPGSLGLIGSEREVSVLFSDIRNFTPYSEAHSAEEVVRLLNAYFTAVVPIIEAEHGTLAQYNGDGIMVIYGAPRADPAHALRATRSAIQMVQRVHQLATLWQALAAPQFRIGVGVHTGRAVVGAVGSPRRLDYTAHGDTVNTAARIESGNKELATEILVSEATWRALPPAEQERLQMRLQPYTLTVKGKERALQVYAITAEPAVGEHSHG
jgi:adenylate cyclase